MADLDAMDEEWDVLLYYCIANPGEEVDASEEVVRRRGICTGVGAGATFSDAVEAVKRASGVKQVDDVHRLRLTPQRSWVAISPQVSEYVCKKGDEFFFRVIRRGVSHGIGPPATTSGASGPIDVVKELVDLYADELWKARDVTLERNPLREADTLPIDEWGRLNIPGADPGVCFPICGRHDTLCSLVRGAALAFQNFTRDNTTSVSNDMGIRAPHFNALIAYPGAGKSTIGRDFPRLLRQFWLSGQALNCLEFMGPGKRSSFVQMVNDSLGYSAFLYHNIDDHQTGRLYPVERELASQNSYVHVLALRLLFSAISELVPTLTYEDMLCSISHFAKMITLNDVLIFFRKAVKTSHERPILVSLFLDEINGAEGFGDTTWVQEVLSSYVHSLQATRETKVLLVVSVACTRYTAVSLRLTASRLTPHVPIPVFALNLVDSLTAVTTFFDRLSVTLGRSEKFEPNARLQLCIELTGGMPRYLGFMIRGMVTNQEGDSISASALLAAAQSFDTDILHATMRNTVSLTRWNPGKYRQGVGFAVLVAALRYSLLGETVYRSHRVVDDPNTEENTWGRLEQKGLISLQAVSSDPQVEPDDWPCRVLFPPLLALALHDMRVDYFERGFRGRELSDLKYIAFMIFLVKSPTNEPPPTFTLQDIIPRAWDIHSNLAGLVMPYPGQLKQYTTRDRVTGAALRALVRSLGPNFSLLTSGNYGLDSVHVVDGFLIVTQTRSSDDAEKQQKSDASRIFWSCFSDLTGVARLGHLTAQDLEEEFGSRPKDLRKQVQQLHDDLSYSSSTPSTSGGIRSTTRKLKLRYENLQGMDAEVDYVANTAEAAGCYDLANVVYVYSSDHHIDDAESLKIMRSQNSLCKRIIIRRLDSLGVLDILSRVRHLSLLPVV